MAVAEVVKPTPGPDRDWEQALQVSVDRLVKLQSDLFPDLNVNGPPEVIKPSKPAK